MGRLYYAMVFKTLEHLWILISVGEKVEGGGVSHGTNSLTTAEGWLYLQFLFNFVLPLLCVLVTQSCPTLCDPTNCSPPGFSVHGILQTRILEWVAIPFSRGTSWPRDGTLVSCIAGRFFTVWATGKSFPLLCTQLKQEFVSYLVLGFKWWSGRGVGIRTPCNWYLTTTLFSIYLHHLISIDDTQQS